jgi:LysR family nitrogen assimilation transcriptional regulator
MDVRQLRYFVRVVEAKSFTRAADEIRIAQPALGAQVRRLEEELGAALLVRHSRGVEPTEAGRALLKHAYAILRQIDQAATEVADLSGPPRGAIALGITPTVSALLGARLVQLCAERHSGIALNLVEGLSEQVMLWLAADRVDLGFTYNPQAARGIDCAELLTEELFFVGAPAQLDGLPKAVGFARLVDRPLILPSRPHGLRLRIDAAAAQRGVTLDIRFEIDSVATLRELVEAGVGCTVLPYGSVRTGVRDGTLALRRIARPRLSRVLYLARGANLLESRASRAVDAVIRAVVAERIADRMGYWRARAP